MYMFKSKYENQSLVFFLLTCLGSTSPFPVNGYDVLHSVRNNRKGEDGPVKVNQRLTSLLRAVNCQVTEDNLEGVT